MKKLTACLGGLLCLGADPSYGGKRKAKEHYNQWIQFASLVFDEPALMDTEKDQENLENHKVQNAFIRAMGFFVAYQEKIKSWDEFYQKLYFSTSEEGLYDFIEKDDRNLNIEDYDLLTSLISLEDFCLIKNFHPSNKMYYPIFLKTKFLYQHNKNLIDELYLDPEITNGLLINNLLKFYKNEYKETEMCRYYETHKDETNENKIFYLSVNYLEGRYDSNVYSDFFNIFLNNINLLYRILNYKIKHEFNVFQYQIKENTKFSTIDSLKKKNQDIKELRECIKKRVSALKKLHEAKEKNLNFKLLNSKFLLYKGDYRKYSSFKTTHENPILPMEFKAFLTFNALPHHNEVDVLSNFLTFIFTTNNSSSYRPTNLDFYGNYTRNYEIDNIVLQDKLFDYEKKFINDISIFLNAAELIRRSEQPIRKIFTKYGLVFIILEYLFGEDIVLLCCNEKKPEKHFEDFLQGRFRIFYYLKDDFLCSYQKHYGDIFVEKERNIFKKLYMLLGREI